MAETSYPYVSQPTTDVEYSRFFRELIDDGVLGSVADGTLRVTGDGSGMNVKLAAGSAIVRGYYYNNSAQLTLTIGAASGQPRIDRVVLQLDISAPVASDRIKAIVKPGTPAGSPSAPALTQTDTGIYEVSLFQVPVSVSATSIAAGVPIDDRPYNGGRVGAWVTGQRPSGARKYRMGFNETTSLIEYYTGSVWEGLGKRIRAVDLQSAGKSTLDGRTILVGDNPPTSADGAVGDLYFEY